MAWPLLFRRYIDDGFGITKGLKTTVEYWISEFNKLVESIEIDKFKHGPRVEFMDLLSMKATDSTTVDVSTSKYIRKSRICMHTSLRRAIIENTQSKIMC